MDAPIKLDWRGRPYVGMGWCDDHGATWLVSVDGTPVCEWCLLGRDQARRPKAD